MSEADCSGAVRRVWSDVGLLVSFSYAGTTGEVRAGAFVEARPRAA